MSRAFAAASISADILLGTLSILAVSDIEHETAKHLRKILCNKIGALSKTSTAITHIKMYTASARRVISARVNTMKLAILKALASPKITDHLQHLLTIHKGYMTLESITLQMMRLIRKAAIFVPLMLYLMR